MTIQYSITYTTDNGYTCSCCRRTHSDTIEGTDIESIKAELFSYTFQAEKNLTLKSCNPPEAVEIFSKVIEQAAAAYDAVQQFETVNSQANAAHRFFDNLSQTIMKNIEALNKLDHANDLASTIHATPYYQLHIEGDGPTLPEMLETNARLFKIDHLPDQLQYDIRPDNKKALV